MNNSFVVDCSLAGKTIKQYFEEQRYSTTQIKRFKYDGQILANGKSVTVRYVMQRGDVVEISTNNRLETPTFAQQKAKLLFADKHLYVAFKPYGVAIHPDLAHKKETFGNMLATAFGQGFELHLITRLDKTTSGLVLGALDEVTAQKLNDMQIARQIEKTYVAVVEGHLQGQGEISLPLSRENNQTVVSKTGKQALTFYTALEFDGQNTKVQLTLGSGRTHQIRAHLSAIGYPIVGDKLYGATSEGHIQLQCVKLSFVHPITTKKVAVELADDIY